MSDVRAKPSTDSDTIERVCSALSTESRQTVLAYFEESTTRTASLEEIADHVAANQSGDTHRSRRVVKLRLHHVDLPKLDEAGLLEYDPRSSTVRYRQAEDVAELRTHFAELLG